MSEPQSVEIEINIVEDDLTSQEVKELLERHLEFCRFHTPPKSVNALDIAALQSREGLVFWTAWSGKKLLGCIALQELDAGHAEIKSMHTAKQARGQGIARALVQHLLREAERRRFSRVSLETGSMDGFEPARRLYRTFGFRECAPFGGYVEDPNNVCMTLDFGAT